MMKKYVKRAIAILCTLVLVAGGMYIQTDAKEGKSGLDTGLFYDCDSATGVELKTYANTVTVTETEGEFNEGTGALKSVFNTYADYDTNQTEENNGDGWFRIVKNTPVNLSAYENGGISFQLYISSENMNKLGNGAATLEVELSSSGEKDINEYQWNIDLPADTDRWNKISLYFANPTSVSGTLDLSKINFMCITYKGTYSDDKIGFTVLLDDIRGMKDQSISKAFESKEGALIEAGKAPADTDIPKGYVFAGWYMDQTYTNVLSGTAAAGTTVYAKLVPEEVFGVKLQYSKPEDTTTTVVSGCEDEAEFSKIWHGKVVTKDEVGAVYVKDGNGALYKDKTQYDENTWTEGVRAWRQERASVTLSKAVDFSAANTKLHFSMYINNSAYIQTQEISYLEVEISSAGVSDQQERSFKVPRASLKEGWNDIVLSIDEGTDFAGSGGKAINLKAINFFRVFFHFEGQVHEDLITSVDDIYITSVKGKVLLDCDDIADMTNSNATLNTDTNYVEEGIGSFQAENGQILVRGNFVTSHDISAYEDFGRLHFNLYIGEPGKLTQNLMVEITSSGTYDHQELCWEIDKSYLKEGWNNVNLPLSETTSAIINGIEYENLIPQKTEGTNAEYSGSFNYKTVNYMRIYFAVDDVGSYTDKIYLDDVRAVQEIVNLRFITTVDTLNYKYIGFILQVENEDAQYSSSKYVYKTITGKSSSGIITYNPSEDFAPWSEYFYTRTITGIPKGDWGKEISVTPYWTTQDGTRVYAQKRTTTVNKILGLN